MTKSVSVGRQLLMLSGALLLLVAPLGERPAKADFITGLQKQLECSGDVECIIPIRQPFEVEGVDNSVTVHKDIVLQPGTAIDVFHVFAGLWKEKDLKHLGFLCTDSSCNTLTGFENVGFENPLFDIDIKDLKGLTKVGTVVPEVKDPLPSPQEARNWLPDRPTFNDFFSRFDIGTTGMVPVLFTHLPEPATLTLFGFGLVGLGFAARRRRAA